MRAPWNHRLDATGRGRAATLLAVAALALGAAPAPGDVVDLDLPVLSDNVSLVTNVPKPGSISAAISPSEPTMYVSTLEGVDVYDISAPRTPTLVGSLPLPIWENEGLDYGERPDGTKFVVVGYDDAGYSQIGYFPDSFVDGTETTPLSRITVVDVTNPMLPTIASTMQLSSGTHTLSCVNAACSHVYSSGEGSWSIIDLTDITDPVEVAEVAGHVGLSHDWDLDGAGILWNVGIDGMAAYDVSDPTDPVLLNSTDENGLWDYPLLPTDEPRDEWNNYILHNSYRPHAAGMGNGRASLSNGRAAEEIRTGEVVLVTEEDYGSKPCATAGSFQTWRVREFGEDVNPDGSHGSGSIEPLDLWVPELLDGSYDDVPALGAFCSAHYFTYHQDGFVAQGWYQQGARILDVRDPRDIRQVGYFFTGASEVWDAYWVPERDADGRTMTDDTGETISSELVYVLDAVRGIDVLDVDLPTTAPADTPDQRAPVHRSWVEPTEDDLAVLSERESAAWGFACPLPARTS